MVGRLIACAAVVFVAAGCAAGGEDEGELRPDPPPTTAATTDAPVTTTTAAARPPTAGERRWVEVAGEWALQFGGELNPMAVDDCRASFAEFAGKPPSARVAGVRNLALRVCIANRQLAHARPGSADRKKALAAVSQAEQALNERIYALEFEAGPERPLPVKGGVTDDSRVEPRLTRVLTQVLGRRTEVRCWSERDWHVVATHSPYGPGELGGFVDGAGRIQLAPAICVTLVDVLYRGGADKDPELETAVAVVVFAHEARHAAGVDEEAVAECYAMQDARRTARLLGLSRARADELAELYWELSYPQNEFPYSSPECRNGGKLDLRPHSDVWP